MSLLFRIIVKLYYFSHPFLWGKGLQINGLPTIVGSENIQFGNNISLNDDVYIQGQGGVHIGNNVTLSKGCTILSMGLDTKDYKRNSEKQYRKHINGPVFIGEGTWVCTNATILPGVTIAPHCIIAAGAVCSNSINSECELWGGVPAKFIKKLV